MRPLLARLLIAMLSFAALSVLPAQAVFADDQTADDITWMVRPSDGVEEDGRAWIENELDPGETITEHLLVRNLSPSTVTFRLTAADGYFTDTGRFNMLTAEQKSVAAGTWIDIPEDVAVPSGGDVIVPFTVTVPANATPGDHAAGVAASIRSGADDEVGIESRVGFRVMTRVAGELAPSIAAASSGTFEGTWNPFEPGRLDVDYVVENTGNTRLAVSPQITATALFGLVSFTLAGEPIAEMAPGETRAGTVSLSSTWPLFAYSTTVVPAAAAVSDDLAPGDVASTASTSLVAAVPWAQLAALAVAALLLWAMWCDRRRRERIMIDRVERARQEGRDAALTDAAPASPRGAAVTFVAVLVGMALSFGAVSPAAAAAAGDTDSHEPRGVTLYVDVASKADIPPSIPPVQGEGQAAPPQPGTPSAPGAFDIVTLGAIAFIIAALGAVAYLLRARHLGSAGAAR